MPESGLKPRDGSPNMSQMPLAAPNSPARRGSARSGGALLEPYHDIASTFFSMGQAGDLDDVFLIASRDGDYEKIISLLRRRNEAIINIDVRDRVTGNTPLIWAAKRGHGKIVMLLLKHGADVTLRNYEGQTAVEVASPAIRSQLLESTDKGGPHRTLLQAAWQGSAKLVKRILSEARVDINCRNADGLTPLLLVTRDVQLFEKLRNKGRGYEPQQVVSELLTSRADPNAVDEEGRTPLHYVSSSKAFQGSDIIKMLMKDGSDVHARDRRSFAPIHCASQAGNVDIVVALLDGGSDANARGYAGSTPLHVSAINGHDNVVHKLLQRGADVTLVDDSGLTAVDVAKTKKVKLTLKQAWAEATQVKVKENLGPVRPPSSTSRRSVDGASPPHPPPPKSPKKGGQVIFDTLPSTSNSLDALTPRRAAVTLLQRQLSNADHQRKTEELKMRDVISATSLSRSRTPSAKGITGQRLSPLRNASPNKSSRREIKFTPETKGHDGGRTGSAGRRKSSGDATPTITRECSIPVTMLGLDLDDNVHDPRSKRSYQGPTGQVLGKKNHFYRSYSSESSGDPGDEFYLRGHSSSRTSLSTTNYDWEDSTSNSSPPGSVRTLSASSERRLSTIDERSNASGQPLILDLDQMRVLNSNLSPVLGDGALGSHAYSRHLLPPTPVYGQNGDAGYGAELRDMEYCDYSGSSKENSPRSDEEMDTNMLQPPVDNCSYYGQVMLAVNDVSDLVRPKSVLHHGQFNIASTRVGHSDDSGYKEGETSGSNRSSVTSSDGTTQAEAHTESQEKTKKAPQQKTSARSEKNDPREKLKQAAKDNAAKKLSNEKTQSSSEGQQKSEGNHIAVHSSQFQGNSSAQNNHSVPSASVKRPTCESTPNQPMDAPAPTPQANSSEPVRRNYYIPRQASATGQFSAHTKKDQNATLTIKLVPTAKSAEQKVASPRISKDQTVVPPARPAPPGSAGKEQSKDEVQRSSKTSASGKSSNGSLAPQQSPKQAPPRPVAPPRSRTPSASSISSNSSAGSSREAPARPPPPERPTSSTSTTTTSIKPTAIKLGANTKKIATPTGATPSPKKVVTQTTSFRLSTYLAQKEAMASYNMANDKIQSQGNSNSNTANPVTNDGPSAAPQPQPVSTEPQPVSTRPAIILTSQSQTQIDLTSIPDINTVQPTDLDSSKDEVPVPSPRVKQIQVKEASPAEDSSSNDLSKSSDTVSKSLASISEVKLAEKPVQDEHNGPVIWDPFAAIHAQKQAESSVIKERAPTARCTKSATKRKATERQPSAVQRNAAWKSKEGKINNSDSKKGVRPKSPRGRSKSPRGKMNKKTNKKTKKKEKKDKNQVEVLIPDHPELENVAYIGGLGWEIRTDCNEDDTIKPAGFKRPSLGYDTDEDEPTPRLTVLPNYLDDPTSISELTDRAFDEESNQYLQIPGQPMDMDSDTGDETEEDIYDLLTDAEETVEEVVFDSTPRIVDGVLIEAPKNKIIATKNLLKRGGTTDDDLEVIVPEDIVQPQGKLLNESKEFAGDQNQTETENYEDDFEEEDPLSLSAFDKKGVMHWNKQRTARNTDKSLAQTSKKSPKGNAMKTTPTTPKSSARTNSTVPAKPAPKSARSVTKPSVSPRTNQKPAVAARKPAQKSAATPKQTPKTTPAATPKQTPSATPKQTPSATPKQTPSTTPKATPAVTPRTSPGNTPKQTPGTTPKTTPASSPKKVVKAATSGNQQSAAAPQAPPRRSKMNKNDVVKETETKPIPPKRNINKTKQSEMNKKNTEDATTIPLADEVSGKGESEDKEDKATVEADKVSDDEITDRELERQRGPLSVSEVPENLTGGNQVVLTRDDQSNDNPIGPKVERMVSKDDDTEIDAMIDEILKSTPHPSLSLSLKSQKSDKDSRPQRTQQELLQMSIDARNKLESGLSKSQNGKLFCEVPVHKASLPGKGSAQEKETEEPPVGPLTAEEKKDFEKFVNSLRNMELSISPRRDENHNSRDDNKNQSTQDKPPLPPKPPRQTESRSSGADRSPRFVRKLDSWKDGNGKRVIPVAIDDDEDDEDVNLPPDLTLAGSEFYSDAISVASGFIDQDEGMVPKDGRVLTSRIGRLSSLRCSSAMSANESFTSEDVETIQWKRGNMLGKGAYGKVWCGLTNGGELIAVKQIELNINDMEQAEVEYEKIQEEVELLKTLKHPNIVGYLGTSLEDNIVSIFMQFIPGGSIANLLARFGALEEEVFCHYTRQILEGVVYLHQNNVIHRDIKGGNVMLMHNGIIKLIDFGCAKRLCLNINSLNNSNNNKRLLKSMRGTPYWMAPEVVRETGYGTKSDIWSIGCTVYEMATRKPPWAEVPPMAAIFAIGSERDCPGLPDKFSIEARDFVSKCMTRDQNLRPSATDLLRHPFVRRKKKR